MPASNATSSDKRTLERRFNNLLSPFPSPKERVKVLASEVQTLTEEAEHLLYEASLLMEEIIALRELASFYEKEER